MAEPKFLKPLTKPAGLKPLRGTHLEYSHWGTIFGRTHLAIALEGPTWMNSLGDASSVLL
jgi:hypothetical protein